MARGTFIMTFETSTVTLSMPNWGGESMSVDKEISLFEFWDDTLDTVDRGLNKEPLVIEGVEVIGDSYATVGNLDTMLANLQRSLNDGEEVTISGLDDVHDGVYIVSAFSWDTIRYSNIAYKWKFTLEYVRESN